MLKRSALIATVPAVLVGLSVMSPAAHARPAKEPICHVSLRSGDARLMWLRPFVARVFLRTFSNDYRALSYFADADGDGYADDDADTVYACEATEAYPTQTAGDCDDSNPEVNPDMTEIPGNGLDDDCDASTEDLLPTSCAEILQYNPLAESGFYDLLSDDGETTNLAYCDMQADGGGWTNLDFENNLILLENDNAIDCGGGLSADADSLTCLNPVFMNDDAESIEYLYHHRCFGDDATGDWVLDHVAQGLGHNASESLGFSALSQEATEDWYDPNGEFFEYCYIDGEVVTWDSEACAAYAVPNNGTCVIGTFTLTR